MSYCRWSTDDHQCDVYCYDDVYGGITPHVAGRKYVFSRPLPAPVRFPRDRNNKRGIAKWLRRNRVMSKLLKRSRLVDIGLPHDGKTFNDEDEGAFLLTLMMLRGEGYRIPDFVFDSLQPNKSISCRS